MGLSSQEVGDAHWVRGRIDQPTLERDDNGGAYFRAILLGWENAKEYCSSCSRAVADVHGARSALSGM